jgi:hypothetical protein
MLACAAAAYVLSVAAARVLFRDRVADEDPRGSRSMKRAACGSALWRPAPPRVVDVIAAFVLFRILDIAKPWVIRRSQNLGGGHGIVADDALAGAAACGLGIVIGGFLP